MDDSNPEVFAFLFVGAIAALLIFTVGRTLMLWYWRVNKIIENQENTNKILDKILDKLNTSTNTTE